MAASPGVSSGVVARGAGVLRGFARSLLIAGAGLFMGLVGAPTFASVTLSGQFNPGSI